MEIQFEQNRDFNQSHREEAERPVEPNNETVSDTKEGEKGRPQGEEGNPNQRFADRESYQNEQKDLDRRPSDVAAGNANDTGEGNASAVAGVIDDTPFSVSKQATDADANEDNENLSDDEIDEQ